MNRNLNLEEVNSDAFMGIPYLNYQSVFQKVIFWGSVVLCIVVNLVGNFVFKLDVSVMGIITLLPLFPGVAFGCNYNEDLTLIRYLILIFSKPSTTLFNGSTEDIAEMHKIQEYLRLEEKKRNENKITQASQKQLLLKLIVGIIIGIVVLGITLIIINSNQETKEIHHTVSVAIWYMGGIL